MSDSDLRQETGLAHSQPLHSAAAFLLALQGRRGRYVAAAALVVFVAALYLGLSAYWLVIAAQVCTYAVATMGLDVIFGRTGQLALSHAAFYGLGAYIAALATAQGVPFLLQVPLVLIIAIIAGTVMAVPTLRLSGLRLALVTLLFGEVMTWFLTTEVSITGGSQGMNVAPLTLLGYNTNQPHVAFLFGLLLGVLATLAMLQLGRSQLGRRMLAVRDSETAASACGIDLTRTKVEAFVLGSIFAAMAGWLFAFVEGFVAPDTFSLFPSAYFLVAVILGGAGSVLGAWLGGAYIVLAPQLFNLIGQPNLFAILGGALLVVVALLMPGGLAGAVTWLRDRFFSLLAANRPPEQRATDG